MPLRGREHEQRRCPLGPPPETCAASTAAPSRPIAKATPGEAIDARRPARSHLRSASVSSAILVALPAGINSPVAFRRVVSWPGAYGEDDRHHPTTPGPTSAKAVTPGKHEKSKAGGELWSGGVAGEKRELAEGSGGGTTAGHDRRFRWHSQPAEQESGGRAARARSLKTSTVAAPGRRTIRAFRGSGDDYGRRRDRSHVRRAQATPDANSGARAAAPAVAEPQHLAEHAHGGQAASRHLLRRA